MNYNQLISLCKPTAVSGTKPNGFGALRSDSRQVNSGDLFIAMRGLSTDGHQFINEAVKKGAAVIISEESYEEIKDVHLLQVEDTRQLIGPLAQAFAGNPADKMKVIGITGTNGKTTVATLTYQVLQQLGAKAALLGTVAKRIGDEVLDSRLTTADPIELASDMQQMADADATHLVMEVSSHALDQQRVKGIDFDVAAFTNLSRDHLDYHETLEAYAHAKKKLFESLDSNDTAIINGDDPQAELMAADCSAKVISFSFTKALDIDCQILANSTKGMTLRIDKLMVKSSLMGTFNAYNIAEAFLICRSQGYGEKAVARALQQAKGAAGRLERVESNPDQPVVLVDYAHTPDALKNVLQTLAELKTDRQKLHVIFGCGGDRDKGKRPAMANVSETYADEITVTSDNPRSENPDAIIDDIMPGFKNPSIVTRITDREEAIVKAIRNADAATIILIAGKGHETYQEIGGQRRDFDDRKIAGKELGNINMNAKPAGS